MHISNPAVSILMPVYNGLPYLTEALDDLLAQTFLNFELVVVDDASTDETASVLAAYAEKDGRIRVIRNEQNRGLPASLNRGLQYCRAPLVARADDDDRYAPDRLARQVAFLEAHPEVGVVSCACHKIDAEGERFTTVRHHPTENDHIRMRELFVNSISHPGVMFRRELVCSVGGYDPAYWTSEDADLWARLRPLTRMANLSEPLLAYRKHGSSMVQSRNAKGARLSLSVRQRLLEDYLGRPVSLRETKAASDLYRDNFVPGATIPLALKLLRETLQQARAKEQPSTVRYYRREVAQALLQQAIMQQDKNREQTRLLLRETLQWDWRLALSLNMLKQAAKAFLPAPAVTALRTAKSASRELSGHLRRHGRRLLQMRRGSRASEPTYLWIAPQLRSSLSAFPARQS